MNAELHHQESRPDITRAIEESAKCLLCHDAPCSKACPAGTDPARFIRSIRFENYKGAAETVRKNNILGGICGLICPYDHYCEHACIKAKAADPVRIGWLQQFAVSFERESGMKILEGPDIFHEKVAVIGSGPSGLACSAELTMRGYRVTVFEAREKPGGWLRYGIPEDRLPQDLVDYEIGLVQALGVEIKTNVKVGRDITIEELKKQHYGAVVVAVGLQKSGSLGVKGSDHKQVLDAAEFLRRSKTEPVAFEKTVVVIGGGDVAADCALSAKKQGAKDVKILYRRKIENMPANSEERMLLFDAQIPIFTGLKPTEIRSQNEKLISITASGMFDESLIELPCDMVIVAVGQAPQDVNELAPLGFSEKGFVQTVDYATGCEGVFACGDIIDGDKAVVYAVKLGKEAAEQVDRFLRQKSQNETPKEGLK